MREWLSGRASPCQGERREFESRLPLQKLIIMMSFFCVKKRGVKKFNGLSETAKPYNVGSGSL